MRDDLEDLPLSESDPAEAVHDWLDGAIRAAVDAKAVTSPVSGQGQGGFCQPRLPAFFQKSQAAVANAPC